MIERFSYNRKRVGFGICFFIIAVFFSVWMINKPENFVRNFLLIKEHVQVIGFFLFIYGTLMLYSFIQLFFFKSEAFSISEDCLVDNSRYESLGVIHFKEIEKVERIKKHSLKLVLKSSINETRKIHFFKKVVFIANNWSFGNSVIVSSALLDCDIDHLEKVIITALKKYKSL